MQIGEGIVNANNILSVIIIFSDTQLWFNIEVPYELTSQYPYRL